jgi:hypothetical protein
VLLSAIVLYPTYSRRGDLYVPFALAAAALVLFTMFGPGIRSRAEVDTPSEP